MLLTIIKNMKPCIFCGYEADAVGCSDLLAIIKESFDIESFADRWRDQGYTIADAQKAKDAYEDWSGEDIAFDCVDDAIMGANLSGGIFPARLEAFFAAWILSANAKV